MLTPSELHKIAVKKQSSELNIQREYLQHLFLSSFYQQPKSDHLFFKGGTALRLLYNSPRFSQDLDFSTPKGSASEIEDAIEETLIQIEREGIKTEIIESKKTSGGYLAIIEFLLNGERVNIQLEISFRDRSAKGEVITIPNDFIPPYTVVGLTKDQLVAQKIRALLARQKPRDFYDIYYILRANLLSPKQKSHLKEVSQVLKKTTISFSAELEQFLPKSHWPQIRTFSSILNRELEKTI